MASHYQTLGIDRSCPALTITGVPGKLFCGDIEGLSGGVTISGTLPSQIAYAWETSSLTWTIDNPTTATPIIRPDGVPGQVTVKVTVTFTGSSGATCYQTVVQVINIDPALPKPSFALGGAALLCELTDEAQVGINETGKAVHLWSADLEIDAGNGFALYPTQQAALVLLPPIEYVLVKAAQAVTPFNTRWLNMQAVSSGCNPSFATPLAFAVGKPVDPVVSGIQSSVVLYETIHLAVDNFDPLLNYEWSLSSNFATLVVSNNGQQANVTAKTLGGPYAVVLEVGNECRSVSVDFPITVSSQRPAHSPSPNPARVGEILTVAGVEAASERKDAADGTAVLYDYQGSPVWQSRQAIAPNTAWHVPTSGLRPGLYILRLPDGTAHRVQLEP